MKLTKTLRNSWLVLVAAIMISCPAMAAEEPIDIDGSTTVGPIADAFKEAFEDIHPDASLTIKKTGSGDGAAALVADRTDIAMMSRFMKPKEFKTAVDKGIYPVAHVVAMDGVCVVVHPSNTIDELTSDQVKAIYKGEITNWKELGGPDMKIVPVSRDTASGTYETFHKLVMKKEKMDSGVEYVNSNPQAHARVSKTQGAIAYVGLGFLDRKVKALEIDGVTPTRRTIAKGLYPVSRPLYLFTNGYPKLGSLVHAFCTFHLSEEGQEIIESKGFVPLTDY
ncbi:Phosphate-binding protein PstS 1 precursor [Anaerohalosphaera lusitana]|uniref:Phosphate-binding protein n=1 Tax=Anaerohalosphaera lusitana TaxID=1936003 RepID=A0A1U9NNN9_9BACT|nr:phosphate ABC transporter substrate-binding protein [Anaerohalosphaera lusitana]AQT69523.1 Phosphate-binding protein PstS 1 precursor [Anaerohalosphaera lusitana]